MEHKIKGLKIYTIIKSPTIKTFGQKCGEIILKKFLLGWTENKNCLTIWPISWCGVWSEFGIL